LEKLFIDVLSIYNLIMITHNSSSPAAASKAKVLVLEIGENIISEGRKNMFKSHKLRKTIPIESKQTKAVNFL